VQEEVLLRTFLVAEAVDDCQGTRVTPYSKAGVPTVLGTCFLGDG